MYINEEERYLDYQIIYKSEDCQEVSSFPADMYIHPSEVEMESLLVSLPDPEEIPDYYQIKWRGLVEVFSISPSIQKEDGLLLKNRLPGVIYSIPAMRMKNLFSPSLNVTGCFYNSDKKIKPGMAKIVFYFKRKMSTFERVAETGIEVVKFFGEIISFATRRQL